jgi:Zn finger protein HypA/HybF involved in hydrogenase expression
LACTQCNANYAFNYSANNSCILCNGANQTILNNTCFYGTVQNCQQYQMSSTPGTVVCTQCNANYAFNYSANTSCILCNATDQTILYTTCFTGVQYCQQYQMNSTNPGTLVCTQCNANYAFNYSANNSCILCNGANQTILNNTCFYGTVQNCQLYQMSSSAPGTLVCSQCIANYAFTYGTTNCDQCSASNQVILNNTCYTSVENCQV